jgi:hypothetical protein
MIVTCLRSDGRSRLEQLGVRLDECELSLAIEKALDGVQRHRGRVTAADFDHAGRRGQAQHAVQCQRIADAVAHVVAEVPPSFGGLLGHLERSCQSSDLSKCLKLGLGAKIDAGQRLRQLVGP